METKKFVQFGTVLVIIFLPLFIIFLIMTLTLGLRDNASLIMFSSITLIILIVLLWFYRIVIEINETYISFKLGVGIFGKKYRVESLLSCKPVTNPILYGLGIKKIPNGWIFNVSGLKAIELSFKDKKSIVRIGTNKPQEIAEIINKLIKKQGNAEQYSGETANSKSINTYIIVGSVIVVFVILILIPFYNNRDSKVILNRENMKISDVYGITIKYKDINRIDTLALLPKIEIRTNGYSFGNYRKGDFRLNGIGAAKLFVDYRISPFIKLTLNDKDVLFINYKDHQSTVELYNKLKMKIDN